VSLKYVNIIGLEPSDDLSNEEKPGYHVLPRNPEIDFGPIWDDFSFWYQNKSEEWHESHLPALFQFCCCCTKGHGYFFAQFAYIDRIYFE